MKKKIVIERALDQEITTFDELIEMLECSGMDAAVLELSLRSYKEANEKWWEAIRAVLPSWQVHDLDSDRAYRRGMLIGTLFQLFAVGLLSEEEVLRLIKNSRIS